MASALGVLCLGLLASLDFATWRANAAELERDALARELRTERAARMEATFAARDVEMSAARYSLDTRVRSDLVDERMLAQEQRSVELDERAANVERERTIKADCVTPRSGIASGLRARAAACRRHRRGRLRPQARVQIREVPVPTPVTCVDPARIPPEPPRVAQRFNGNAKHDFTILAANAKELREWGEEMRAARNVRRQGARAEYPLP